MPDQLKKLLRMLGIGFAWVFFLSIPLKGHPIFYHIYSSVVPSGLVNAIGHQAEEAWYKSKAIARSALSDAEDQHMRQF